jgi:hypothetical protein
MQTIFRFYHFYHWLGKGVLTGWLVLAGLSVQTQAQSVEAAQTAAAEEQNETFRDTLVRMRIKREEEEHKKIVGKAEQLKELSAALAKEATGTRLPRLAEKKLKEIEKFARNIRAESGGGDDEPLETPPQNLADTLKQLGEASERLNEKLSKTSRHVVSLTVVAEATEIIQLVKLLRGYLH